MPPSFGRREPGTRHAVRPVELRVRHRGRHVLVELDRAVGGDAGEHEAVGAERLDRGGLRTEVRRLRVDALVARDLEALLLGGALDVPGEAASVDLLVVEDVDGGAAVLLHDGCQRGTLNRVLRDDAQVVALARRVVLVGLALVGARLVRGQADGGVRRADLGDRDLVQDRDRDGARARVELADVGDEESSWRPSARSPGWPPGSRYRPARSSRRATCTSP